MEFLKRGSGICMRLGNEHGVKMAAAGHGKLSAPVRRQKHWQFAVHDC